MIGYLDGKVIIRDDPYVILDINGVGYRVHAASDILSSIGKIGSNLKLYTYTHVREDELTLFGFLNYSDLKLFEQLINVSGVGPRTAISIFSVGNGDEIKSAIITADTTFFTRVPRLGSKNAQKIIIELKNKMGGDGAIDLTGDERETRIELSNALKSFGFSGKEIGEAVRNIDRSVAVEEQIKLALKYLGK